MERTGMRDLTKGKIAPTLIRFALPFFGANILQFLYGVVDMAVVGRFSNAAGLSAVNTASQIMTMVTFLITGIATGGTVLIGQYIGAGRKKEVGETIGNMVVIFAVLAAAVTLALALLRGNIIALMKVPQAAREPAGAYLLICALGTVFITGYNLVSSILRGMGDSKRPMYFVAVACGINIVGDLLLVGRFQMGAAGAALATVVAQAVSFLLALVVLRRGGFPYPVRVGAKKAVVGRILRLGVPVALQDVLTSFSFLIMTVIVNTIGLEQSAAVGAVERILTFSMVVPISFSGALAAFTAQCIGAGLSERARKALRISFFISLAISAVVFGVIEVIPATLLHIFSKEAAVIAYGAEYIRIYALDVLMVCGVFSMNGFFNGCGRTTFTMATGLCATFLVRIPLALLFNALTGGHLMVIAIAAPAASAVQIVVQRIYFATGRWRGASEGSGKA